MKKSFMALACAALALGATACGAPAAPGSAPAASQPGPGEIAPAGGAGAVRRLTEATGSGRYEVRDASDAAQNPYFELFYVDYGKALELPVCNNPACAHADGSCAAWDAAGPGSAPYTVWADGENLYRVYWSGEENPDPEKQHARIEVGTASNGNLHLLCALGESTSVSLVQNNAAAMADDTALYLDLIRNEQKLDGDGALLEESVTHTLEAVSLADGARTVLHTWPQEEDAFANRLVGGEGRSLYFYTETWDEETGWPTGGLLRSLDLDTGELAETARWQDRSHATDAGMVTDQATAVVMTPDGAPLVLRSDEASGTVTSIDPGTGAESPFCTGLPANTLDDPTFSYDFRALGDWCEVTAYGVDPATGSFGQSKYLVPRAGGEATPMTLAFYDSVKDYWSGVELLDEYGDQFYCMTGWETYTVQELGKDGTPYTSTRTRSQYAMLPIRDALAGNPNYTQIQG